MSRRRMIDPSFWDDEDICSLPDSERLLFLSCICSADDEGKLSGSPATIKKIAFGMTDTSTKEVENMLQNISNNIRGFHRYSVEDKSYIKLVNWKKYQRVDHPQKSVIPEPDGDDSKNDSKNEAHQLNNELTSEELIDEVLIKGEVTNEDKCKGSQNSSATDHDFETWWLEYPKKVGKLDAQKSWDRQARDKKLLPMDNMMAVLKRQIKSDAWTKDNKSFIPNPATYLNQGRWLDVPLPGKQDFRSKDYDTDPFKDE
jgi:hypothetical protein